MNINITAVVFWIAIALLGFAIFGTLQATAAGLAIGMLLTVFATV